MEIQNGKWKITAIGEAKMKFKMAEKKKKETDAICKVFSPLQTRARVTIINENANYSELNKTGFRYQQTEKVILL